MLVKCFQRHEMVVCFGVCVSPREWSAGAPRPLHPRLRSAIFFMHWWPQQNGQLALQNVPAARSGQEATQRSLEN